MTGCAFMLLQHCLLLPHVETLCGFLCGGRQGLGNQGHCNQGADQFMPRCLKQLCCAVINPLLSLGAASSSAATDGRCLTAHAHLLFTVLLVLQHTVDALLDYVANVVWCKANLCKVNMQKAWLRFVPTDNSAVARLVPSLLTLLLSSFACLVNVGTLFHLYDI